MTREDIEKMQAGRELDALIEKEVMKLFYTFRGEYPSYSTNIAAAWEVVKEMSAKNYWCEMGVYSTFSKAIFCDPKVGIEKFRAEAGCYELPIAICRAALLSVMKV